MDRPRSMVYGTRIAADRTDVRWILVSMLAIQIRAFGAVSRPGEGRRTGRGIPGGFTGHVIQARLRKRQRAARA